MKLYPISIAGIFTRKGDSKPFCSVCFFSQKSETQGKYAIVDYIKTYILPSLASVAINSNKESLSREVSKSVEKIKTEFNVDCVGFLNEYNLEISRKREDP